MLHVSLGKLLACRVCNSVTKQKGNDNKFFQLMVLFSFFGQYFLNSLSCIYVYCKDYVLHLTMQGIFVVTNVQVLMNQVSKPSLQRRKLIRKSLGSSGL